MSGKWLDTEIAFRGPVPEDIGATGIVGRNVSWYDPYDARDIETKQQLDNNQLLRRILKNTDIDILLRTLGNAFFPRFVTVGTAPTLLIRPNRYPRGYILINPNTTVSGVVTAVTVFPAGTVFPVAATPSASINVSGHGGAAFFFDVTEASAGATTVDLQTQDPVSGLWATAQSDIFGGAGTATGTFYANVGEIGIDQNARLLVTVTGDTLTGSIGAILKPSLAGTISGPTIFLGNENVTLTLGFPLLAGQKETIYLKENTPLYGIAVAATDLRLFELQ
jgi:hypothetical protein